MAHRVIKPEKDTDLYLIWTTIADGPMFVGKRKKVARWLRDDYPRNDGLDYIDERIERTLERVDRLGSTDGHRRVPIWEDEGGGMIYANNSKPRLDWLPFKNLMAFALEFKAAQKAATEDGWSFTPSDSLLEELEH